jgi:hypothetical protein
MQNIQSIPVFLCCAWNEITRSVTLHAVCMRYIAAKHQFSFIMQDDNEEQTDWWQDNTMSSFDIH